MNSTTRDPRIEELAGALCNGRLNGEQADELRRLLREHAGARRLFAEQMQLVWELNSGGQLQGIAMPSAPGRSERAGFFRRSWLWAAGVAAMAIVAVLVWDGKTEGRTVIDSKELADNVIQEVDAAVKVAPEAERRKLFKGHEGSGTLAELRSQGVGIVVYFFKTNPNGRCVKFSTGFSTLESGYRGAGYVIVGISRASVEELEKFKARCVLELNQASELNQALLRDADGRLGKVMSHLENDFDTFTIEKDGRHVAINRKLADEGAEPGKLLAFLMVK